MVLPQCAKVKMSMAHRVFDERRRGAADPDKLKCSCAEALCVYGLLRSLGNLVDVAGCRCFGRVIQLSFPLVAA